MCTLKHIEHIGKDQALSNVLWTDESMTEFGHINNRHVWSKLKTAFQEQNLITVKRDGRNVMI